MLAIGILIVYFAIGFALLPLAGKWVKDEYPYLPPGEGDLAFIVLLTLLAWPVIIPIFYFITGQYKPTKNSRLYRYVFGSDNKEPNDQN